MTLVLSTDNAYACDPRVKRFKDQAKAEREAEKREKAEAAKREAELRRQVRCGQVTVQ